MATDSASKKPILSLDDILSAADTPEEVVFVKEWGGSVKVRGLTKRQQVDIRRAALVQGEVDQELVQRGIWREGVVEPAFDDEKLGLLFEKNAGAVDRVLAVILKLSGMDEEAVREKEKMFRS